MLNVVKESAQRAKKKFNVQNFRENYERKIQFHGIFIYAQDLYLDNQEIRRKSKDRNEKNYAMNGI